MKSAIVLSVGVGLFCGVLFAQPAQLVKDIYPNPPNGIFGSDPSNFVAAGGQVFFTALDEQNQRGELWKTDGTSSGTVLVKDIFPGESGSDPAYLTNVGGTLFFSADDGSTGVELWKSDGTAVGTVLVKDISSPTWYSGSHPEELTEVGGLLFFSANDGLSGRELWKSDGTEAGTVRVKDIVPGAGGSGPTFLRKVGGTLFFFLSDQASQVGDLWKSDGTEPGTVKVRSFISLYPSILPIAAGGKLLFQGCDPIACGLWASNGTQAGTILLTNVTFGQLFSFAGNAYFSANDGVIGFELWTSDGTVQGTHPVKDLLPGPAGSSPFGFEESAGSLFFFAWNGASVTLWKSDGSEAGTQVVESGVGPNGDSPPRSAGGILYFITPSYELWRSDGTTAGTVPIRVVCSFSSCSTVRELAALGNLLFFRGGDDTSGIEPWVSNGTVAGTRLLKDINREPRTSRPRALLDLNGLLLCSADDGIHGREPWKSDGTPGGTALLRDINTFFNYDSMSGGFAAVGLVAVFGAGVNPSGLELWKTDGTTEGTDLVKDINPTGSSLSLQPELVSFGNAVYFPASDGVQRSELWKSDGTTGGTVLVKVVETGTGGGIGELTVANGSLFFIVAVGPYNSALACSLWKSDGTAEGTAVLKSLNPACNNDFPRYLTASGNLLFFSAYDAATGQELWKSDGTPEGTVRVKDIIPGSSGSDPRNPVDVNGILFFSATDGSGYELWRSDGTPAGTYLVRDILAPPSTDGSFPQFLTNAGGILFFTANDGLHGRELWKSDGTQIGTVMVRDIRTGPSGSSPQHLTNVYGTLLFAAADHTHGMELWKSDGSADGTVMLQDIRPGPGSSQPFASDSPNDRWVVSGSSVYFTANDGTTGYELWALPISTLAPQSNFYTLMPCRVADTRDPMGPYGGPPLPAGVQRVFQLAGRCGIPSTAKSVAINLTVTGSDAQGHLIVYPGGSTIPTTSSINYRGGQTRANNVIVPLGVGGTLAVSSGQISGSTHVIIDVTGYFE